MVRFEDAIDVALEHVREKLGSTLTGVTVVRDVTGRLALIVDDSALASGELHDLALSLDARLGAYSLGPRQVILRRSDLVDQGDILDSPDRIPLAGAPDSWLVDRLLTNQDWIRRPRLDKPPLPVGVAYSLKGGVGRSTAIAVLAWHLARLGKNIMVMDLDLEAPGLGSLLLGDLPEYGIVDWLTEAAAGQADSQLLEDCLTFSTVAEDASGIVQVAPAFGARTRDYISKVGRVFLPGLSAEGNEIGLAERLRDLLQLLADRRDAPDVLLLDARAGLHDIGAATVTQLGAEVFLFARDEPQTWTSLRLLLQHLSHSRGIQYGMPDADLRWRLKMVGAQLDRTEGALASCVESSYETWTELYDDESRTPEDGPAALTFTREDSDAPHYPLPLYFEPGFRGASLGRKAARPPWPLVEAAFGPFLEGATSRLLPERGAETTAEA